jgi:hypothetical protein
MQWQKRRRDLLFFICVLLGLLAFVIVLLVTAGHA